MITTKKQNLNRLLELARHLGKKYLHGFFISDNYVQVCDKADSDVEHISSVISELPKVFSKHWHYKEDEIPCLNKCEKLNSLAATAVYFNLTGDELFHLFVPGYQDPIYQGKKLSPNYTIEEVVHNIYQFILFKENKLECAFETVNYKSLIKNKYRYEYPELSNRLSKLSA